MGKKAHFCGELPEGKFVLTNVISIDSVKQSGKFLKEFIDLVNKNRDKISKIIFIDTTYLNRHYDLKYEEETISAWRKSHELIIRNHLQIEWEIRDWRTVISMDRYQDMHAKLKLRYSEDSNYFDKAYREKVVSVANSKKDKGNMSAKIEYLIEESAGFLSLDGIITYPGTLNAALDYCYHEFKSETMRFIKHAMPDKIEKNNVYHLPRQNGNQASFFRGLISEKIEELEQLSVERQVKFYKDFESLYNLYAKELRDMNGENQRKAFSWS